LRSYLFSLASFHPATHPDVVVQPTVVLQIAETHPRLVSELAEHPGIGFVLVRSEAHGPLVIGVGGRRRLTDDSVEGEDPLAAFGPSAADHLRRHDSFPHCPDLLVNSAYDPHKDEVGPFEEFMGSHGGLGGPQMNPVAVVPTSWSEPPTRSSATKRCTVCSVPGLRRQGCDHSPQAALPGRQQAPADAVNWGLATVGVTLLLLATASRRLVSTPITPAMVVVAIGLLAGPLVLDDLTVGPTSATVRRLAEATLAVVLFSDSSRIDLRALLREASIPVRVLGIGLPLTIALGALVALVLFGSFSLSEALILGVILVPTDAGLGSAVVTDGRLAQRLRQSLNVESGLNDGICVPLLLIVLATASGAAAHPAQVIGEEIGYGLVGGIVAGTLAAQIVITAGARRLIDDAWRQIIPAAAAVLAYGIAEALGGHAVRPARARELKRKHAFHRGDWRAARCHHVPRLRRRAARAGARARELA
jgi:Sodium/hydrogen exchanger family